MPALMPELMPALRRGRYTARFAETPHDVAAAQALRALVFRGPGTKDADAFDSKCRHILVHEQRSGTLVCCFRLLPLRGGPDIETSYAAQFYGLSSLQSYSGKMVEMGRFCVHPDHAHPDVLRVAWGALTRYVDREGVQLLFGCSSFQGTRQEDYLDTFAMLKERHLAPKRWLPKVKAPDVFRFAERLRRKPDRKAAMTGMPPLLKTYLLMGGWVSDHAVVDADLGTLHVFTGLEIKAIPPSRARALRAIAAV